ncbi:MAG: translational GTPase TypA [Alphaproteobacteria bacterium]|nr:translational GTPase TypA [Alphaproteobacteria bacterium]MCB9698035.1 translational GTPase TypA [Alphaproteobacteria bacterium]
MQFRNIAIIAHVDHGKTTLVDAILRQCRAFAEHEQVVDRVMDSMDLERERGITIASKNTAVVYEDHKINIVDTPGHADFGGEVERVLSMVDGAMLLVDASEGPLPQTRFVLRKALEAGLKVMVCINKIDRPDARAQQVLQEVYDLFIDLGADDELLEFPVLYAVAREGRASLSLDDPGTDLRPLLDTILKHVPPPPPKPDATGAQLLITNLDYDPYVGRLAFGRLVGKPLRRQTTATLFAEDGQRNVRVQLVYTWQGLKRVEVDEALPGDIVALAGIEEITVGDSVATGEDPQPLPRIKVDEPTIGMTITINSSPFSGRDGKYLTGRQIKERLDREMLTNVSLRLEKTDTSDSFKLFGRGELQLGILVEQMRREGFELSLSRPEVRFKEVDGVVMEPFEEVSLDVPDPFVGAITQQMAGRKGEMRDMQSDGHGRTRMVYRVPTRGMIGFRGKMLTETRGEGVMNTLFDGWDVHAGPIGRRLNGSIVADRTGTTTAYALFHLQPRGELFVGPGEDVYEGMIVGEHCRDSDLNVNAVRGKALTNFRTTASDEKLVLAPPREISLEAAMEYIDDDEWIEVTPIRIRLRKRVLAGNQRSIVRSGRRDEA